MWGVVVLVVCGRGALLLSLSLALTNMSFRFLCRWYAVNGGVCQIVLRFGSSCILCQCFRSVSVMGGRSWWKGMT